MVTHLGLAGENLRYLHRLERENLALRLEISAFHSDPSYIEKVARDELGMVGPDDVIYQFPEPASKKNAGKPSNLKSSLFK
jgi:cell division protein FtsB